MYGSSINESSVFKVWYDSISDVERADVSVLDDVISVRDGYLYNVTCLKKKFF